MSPTADTEWEPVFMRILGDELRKARTQRDWTRKDLVPHLSRSVSLQTLATYELGTRHCSVVRLAEICLALDELPHELLARVHDRVFSDQPVTGWTIDLVTASRLQRDELTPLRRWAACRLGALVEGESTLVRLNMAALRSLAELCAVSTAELIRALRSLSSPTAGERGAG